MSFYDDEFMRDIPVSKADGKRCIVCGTSGTNCTTKGYSGPSHVITMGQDELLAKSDEMIPKVDVWEEREITKGVWAKTLVARAGRPIKKKKAMDLGII